MKTMIKKFALAVTITAVLTLPLSAFEDSLTVSDKNSVDLVISKVRTETKITLKDNRNNVLYNKSIDNNEHFAKSFNLELLQDGDYILEIDNDSKKRIFALSIEKDRVNISEPESLIYYKPVINEKGTAIYVNQFSPERKPLYVAIYNHNNDLVYSEVIKGKMDIGRVYDFSESRKGKYRFYFESNGISEDYLVYIEK